MRQTTPLTRRRTAGSPTLAVAVGTAVTVLLACCLPLTTDPGPAEWPGPRTTGVPDGTTLSPYTGPCTITAANTYIEAKTIRCDLEIRATNVTVRTSRIIGTVSSTQAGSLILADVEVDAGTAFAAATGEANLVILRSNVHGGETSVNCVLNCHIQDSWLHGQYVPPDGNWHLDAFLSNGGNHITLKHNTIACDSPTTPNDGGCTADAAIFGDFAPNNYYTFDNNLFVASVNVAYCLYGGSQSNKKYGLQTDHIVVINNVFQKGSNGKCGAFGPITYFDSSRPGNRWENNVWDDGTTVPASM